MLINDIFRSAMNSKLAKIHPYAWIFLIGLLVWGWTVSFGFVWDDFPMIVTNPSLNSWNTLISGWTHDFWMLHESPHISGYWRPMATLIHVLLAHMFGKNPWAFHLVNVLLHIGTACAFYTFIKNLGLVRWIWIPVLFFLVHPIQAETVSFSSAIPDLLCAFFGWLALATWTQKTENKIKQNMRVFICLALCLLSKESGVFFVVFLFLVTWIRRDIDAGRSKKIVLASWIALCAFYIYFHYRVTSNLGIRNLWGETLVLHFATACKLFGYQIFLLFFPFGSSPTRDFKIVVTLIDPKVWIGFALLIACLSTALYCWKTKKRDWLLIVLGFLVFWFPVSNVIPAEGLIADRYLYVMVMMMGLALGKLFSSYERVPKVVYVTLGVFGILTYFQSLSWMNEKYLWSHAVRTSPHSSVAWNEWGGVLFKQKNFTDASEAYEKASQLNPFYREASFNRALVAYASNDVGRSKSILAEHLGKFPQDDEAYDLLGAIYESESNYKQAIEASQAAIRISPKEWKYRYNLGEVFLKMRDYPNAIMELQAAYDLVQNRFEILKNLALAYFQNGQYHEARDTYEMFIRKFPEKVGEIQVPYEKSKQILQMMEGS